MKMKDGLHRLDDITRRTMQNVWITPLKETDRRAVEEVTLTVNDEKDIKFCISAQDKMKLKALTGHANLHGRTITATIEGGKIRVMVTREDLE
jgi:hypothetical protein